MFKAWFDNLKRVFGRSSEPVYVVDGLHQQFLKEELIDRCSRGISLEKRQLYAGLVVMADSLSYQHLSVEEMMPKLEEAGLDSIIALTHASDSKALCSQVLNEMRGLIGYWEEPHLEIHALPVVEKALRQKLNLPE